MNKIRQNIPNAITCGNLLCGCLAIVQAFEGDLVLAAYLVGIAAVLDFFDGFAARMLKVSSPIGKDLDSLADMVTFGVVPGILLFKMVDLSILANENFNNYIPHLRYLAFIIPVFSAIRLAKFNNDARQIESFIGLSTPANAILICSFPLIIESLNNTQSFLMFNPYSLIFTPYNLLITAFVLSFLLIAPLPLFSLKFKSFGWKGNEIRFLFLLLSLILLITLQFVGIPLIIVLYVLMSIVNNIN